MASRTHSVSGWYNQVPIAVMSGGWLGPLLLFWMGVWGPLRPHGYAPVPSGPTLAAFLLMLAASAAASRVSAGDFRLRPFEVSGGVYEAVGVRLFRRIVPDGDFSNRLRRTSDPAFRVIRTREEAAAFQARTEESERGHLVRFVDGIISSSYAAWIGWGGWALLLGGGNIPVNLYPILLQRYTRARISRARRARGGAA